MFATADALAAWMAANGHASSAAAAQAFIADGWAPTAGTVGGTALSGVECMAATTRTGTGRA